MLYQAPWPSNTFAQTREAGKAHIYCLGCGSILRLGMGGVSCKIGISLCIGAIRQTATTWAPRTKRSEGQRIGRTLLCLCCKHQQPGEMHRVI
ncbi:hypothetical protein HYQ46_013012 [Verticillium longisporum]|nr:hypothetical protein HYQ46_013012 [Verticillium longisporum]